jgi:hypothetical protein
MANEQHSRRAAGPSQMASSHASGGSHSKSRGRQHQAKLSTGAVGQPMGAVFRGDSLGSQNANAGGGTSSSSGPNTAGQLQLTNK